MHPLLNIAISAAKQAGDIIVRHMDQLDRLKVSAKSHQDFFSEVDIKAEQAIIRTIHKAYPEHGIIAEESGLHNENSETVWIIDPLDGTNNFLHGFPFYAVSIAVQVHNKIEHGVVYDPIRHEFFSASRGGGARLNDRRIRVSKQTQLSTALIGTGLSSRTQGLTNRYLATFEALFENTAALRRTGAAALDLAYVASGRLDGFWEIGLHAWDIAAGALLVREAGGLVSDLKGGEDYLKQGDIVAGTPKIFKSFIQTLQPAIQS